MSILSGPRAAARSGAARSLVIFLHGYGADGADLFGLAEALAPHLPDTAFRSPNAPEPCAVNPGGRQWFPISWLDGTPEAEMRAGARRSAATLAAYLAEAMEEEGVAADRTVLVGFSQGTMMSLSVGLRAPSQLAGIVGFSGKLVIDEEEGPISSYPPVLLIHGDQDEVIPVEAIHEARAGLAAAGVPVTWHISPGVGHGIGPDGLRLALDFISRVVSPTKS
ncbi:alpha/beta hydrolase [Pikeienuella sp. HZG-20]|uniref:alpha/beta hydrolase n=1 Tax=Paludibacillus litoralis TaxID=3133267 RepID=UPI0030EB4BF3